MNPKIIWTQMHEERGAEDKAAPAGLRWAPSAWDACLAARDAKPPAPLAPDELAELRAANAAWGADDAALAAIETLGKPGTRVVVTGQQPGLMAGPLLTIYKTLQAIRLAKVMAEKRPGETWTPVFWVASEDHDFEEIRRAYWPAGSGDLEEFLLDRAMHQPGAMVGNAKIGAEQLEALINQLETSTNQTEFKSGLLETLREAYGNGHSLEHGFCTLMLRMLRGTGLVIVSPNMRWLRLRAVAVLRAEFQFPARSSRQVIERGAEMAGETGDAALHRRPNAVNAFWLDAEGRRHTLALAEDGRIEFSGNGRPGNDDPKSNSASIAAATPNENGAPYAAREPIAREELLAELEAHPESFSLNVVTRPLVQDAALPVAAQVVGPGEAAYLAQVEAAYDDFGVVPPMRYPRPEILLLEPRVVRQLEKYKLSLEEALGRDAAELGRLVSERDLSTGILAEIETLHAAQIAALSELEDRAIPGLSNNSEPRGMGNTAPGRVTGNSTSIHAAFDKLRKTMDKGYDTIRERILYEHQAEGRQLDRAMSAITSSLHPADRDQERALTPLVPFAFNYGWEWPLRLLPLLGADPTLPPQTVNLADLAK